MQVAVGRPGTMLTPPLSGLGVYTPLFASAGVRARCDLPCPHETTFLRCWLLRRSLSVAVS